MEEMIIKKRVAAYCRVSSKLDEQKSSIQIQIDYFQKLLIKNSEYILVDILYDTCSGLRTHNRPGYLKLKSLIENDEIDIFFCKSLSRASRDTLELIKFTRLLIDKNIILNEGGRFIYDLGKRRFEYELLAAFYQYEIEVKSDALKWAYKIGFERGDVYMTTLYGYKSVKNNIMVIDYEAIIVKEAYNLYLDGKSDYEIARIFEEQKYLNKSGNVDWSYRRIRDMLTNLKYTGDSIGPKTYSTNIISGKRYERMIVLISTM